MNMYNTNSVSYFEINCDCAKKFHLNTNVTVVCGDQNKLMTFPTSGKYDLIVDDGPHTDVSMRNVLRWFSRHINKGGVLVIEALQVIENKNWIINHSFSKDVMDLVKEINFKSVNYSSLRFYNESLAIFI